MACLHNSEDFERWLIPHLQKHVEVYPFDYRTVGSTLDVKLSKTVSLLDVDSVFVVKGESIKPETIIGLNEIGIKTGCWTIDDHAHPELFLKPYTHIWTPSPRLIDDYKKRGYKYVHELAFYVEPSAFKPQPQEKIAISFLGTRYDGREEKITKLREAGFPVRVFGDQWTIQNDGRITSYNDCIDVRFNTMVNLNIHQATMRQVGALNTKMYDVPASGGFMVTDYFPEVLRKFNADQVALYNPEDNASLLSVVKRYLANPKERQEVIERARVEIFKNHTAEKRAEQILREFK